MRGTVTPDIDVSKEEEDGAGVVEVDGVGDGVEEGGLFPFGVDDPEDEGDWRGFKERPLKLRPSRSTNTEREEGDPESSTSDGAATADNDDVGPGPMPLLPLPLPPRHTICNFRSVQLCWYCRL
jgi:hypothetical protein